MTPKSSVYNRSIITKDGKGTRLDSIAYANSDDVKTLRELSRGVANCVSSGASIVYDAHKRFEKEER